MMKMQQNNTDYTVTYEPDNELKKGYIFILKEIVHEFIGNRWLIFQLFRRDFLSIYKQSLMGILWAFIVPFVSVATFIILNRSGIFEIGNIDVPYPIYAILGISFWQLFSTGIIAGSNSLVKAGSMIVKINFSKKSLVIASTGQSIISFLIQFLIVCILFITYGVTPDLKTLLLPLLIIPVFLLTLGLGFIFALLNGIIRDIGNAMSMLLTFLMFLTPVLYAKPESGILAEITKYNLLYYLVSVPRDLILTGYSSDIASFFISTLISIAVFIICILVFHLTETRVAERI
jgi:lipopolysaccharide transport system permease protein